MPRLIPFSGIILTCVVITYAIISKLIFDKVYITSKQVIDEEFHIPQGLAYCNYHFDTWNPKITTLPGLYFLTTVFLAPFGVCSIYWLRFINLAASVLNFILFYALLNTYNKKVSQWKNIFSSLNLAILPPLYFFSNLYYTDVLSLTFVLLMLYFEKDERHILASISGMMAVIMRQTNIIWVAMVSCHYILLHVCNINSFKKKAKESDLKITIKDLYGLKSGISFRSISLDVWLNVTNYAIVMISFLLFIIFNGGIVVGDKTAHSAGLHIPQLFYFALFCFIFMWPYFVPNIYRFLKIVTEHKLLFACIAILFAVAVYFNTVVHPYLLADNRHYTFYVWNRGFGKHIWMRYIMILGYIYFLYCIWSVIYCTSDVSFAVVYIPCTVFVLILQKMIEIRYFFIPYVLLRLQIKNITFKQLLAEFVFFCVINYLTLNLFFTKNIYWVDYVHPQKLIW